MESKKMSNFNKSDKVIITLIITCIIVASIGTLMSCKEKPTLKDKINSGEITEPIILIHKRPALVQGVHGNKSGLSLKEYNNYGISFMEINDTLDTNL